MGTHDRDVFAVVPEGSVSADYRLMRRASVFVRYMFLYISNVARPAKQVDHSINPTQNPSFGGAPPTPLAGPARPRFKFQGSDLWSQGLSLGVAFQF